MSDAKFIDGREAPLRLIAQDSEDLKVFSTMLQDAIAERKEMLYETKRKSFSALLKRFRWEDAEEASRQSRSFERVQTVLTFNSVLSVKYQGFNYDQLDLAFDLLSIEATDDQIILAFAGDGSIALNVECVDALLSDVSRPYTAKSNHIPKHRLD